MYQENNYSRRKVIFFGGIIILVLLLIFLGIYMHFRKGKIKSSVDVDASRPEISVQLLDVNEYSRPGIESDPITGIVIHYTANPGSTAQNNRDYFNSLQDGHDTFVSSHFVVGLEGEIVQCVPTWEIAYASNERNHDTISIECCHWDETGEFTEETYASMVQLTAFLCDKYGLNEEAVIRHYDVTGKNCPKYFVENEEAWEQFKTDVAAALERGNGEEKE
ncbi:MAG: N-acetylmuramoyl-L-alanine amidase [Ruminococcus sp.]|nr:N-acetylmuramoyl-L-alanine amidase [Ruminococcus sp.]